MEQKFQRKVAELFAGRRKELGLSQEFLAEQLRQDQAHVSKVETCRRKLSLFEVFQWAEVLNLDIPVFLYNCWSIWKSVKSVTSDNHDSKSRKEEDE